MKTIYLKTNYNNKLGCDNFLHIDLAPKTKIVVSQLGTVIEIRTTDNSYPAVRKIFTGFNRFKLGESVDCFTIPSHGMDSSDFIEFFKNEYGLSEGTDLALYFYENIKEN